MRIIFYIAFLVVFLTGGAAQATLTGSDRENLQRALVLADKGDWLRALAHTRQIHNPHAQKFIRWLYVTSKDSGASFGEIADFIEENPDWPKRDTLFIRAEAALAAHGDDKDTLKWLTIHSPETGVGKRRLGEAELATGGNRSHATFLIRQAWQTGIFDKKQESEFLAKHGRLLTQEDHIARIRTLLFRDQTGAAEQLLRKVPESYQKLFTACIRLLRDEHGYEGALKNVPAKLKNEPELLYARMLWRSRKGKMDGVIEVLQQAPAKLPQPELWWPYREKAVRELLKRKSYGTAYSIVKKHGLSAGKEFAEAEWLAGWIALRFSKNPREAYKHFYALYNGVEFPVSQARAAYWAGRAAEANNNRDISKQWYGVAAEHTTTFYGQLALHALAKEPGLALPADPVPGAQQKKAFERSELAGVVRVLGQLGEFSYARQFILHMVDIAKTPADSWLAAGLGKEIGRPELTVRAAKQALRKNHVLLSLGWPVLPIKTYTSLDDGLVLGVIRQESEFDPLARSQASAFGLMQLLPSTAKEVAKKAGMPFGTETLKRPSSNIELGSLYLQRLVESYSGCLPVAIAAYNAGPGNVRGWLATYGSPCSGGRDMVDWLESIPFAETRNYVQRVLENTQVYRRLLPATAQRPLQLDDDLRLKRSSRPQVANEG